MEVHHIGCLVENIESAIDNYNLQFDERLEQSEIYNISSQKVKVCFLSLHGQLNIEFVEPYEENKSLQKMLKKGVNFYHIGYIVSAFDKKLNDLQEKGFRALGQPFHSEAFANKRCIFLYNDQLHLIELIESELL